MDEIVLELRTAASNMREEHPHSHRRHQMWFALADLLEYAAEDPFLDRGGSTPTQKALLVARTYNVSVGRSDVDGDLG